MLGVRAFSTQLLCEQVIGRALRRQSYEAGENGLFSVEYADVLGIPFDFTAKPVVAPPQPPREVVHVRAVRPERDPLEISFPRVQGYRVELPEEHVTAEFIPDSILELTPDLVGPSITQNQGIVGEGADLSLDHLKDTRQSTILFHLTRRLIETKWRDPGDEPKLHLFGPLKRIAKQWMNQCLVCKGGTYVKNHNLGLEVPYRYGSETRVYIPDFIVLVDDRPSRERSGPAGGHGNDDLLRLIVEIKGYRGEDAKDKKNTMDAYWIPGVNNHGVYGRWAFAEFADVYEIQDDFAKRVEAQFEKMIATAVEPSTRQKQV